MTAWTDFVKQYAKENNLSYKESLKQAAPSFKQQKEKPCPKGHTVCSCSAEPPTPAVEPPATSKSEKFKISDELAIFINKPLNSIFTQNEIVRFINSYITKNNLNDYPNRAFFLDDKLAKLFNLPNTKSIRFFEYVKKLDHHFFKIKNDSAEPPTPAEVAPPTKKYKKVKLNIIEDEEPTPEVVPKKLKKKKLKMPSPYRKVTLNIIEDDDIETTTTNERIKQKKKKPRKVKLDIQESPYQNIIDEWDTATLTYVLFQQQPKIYDAIENKILTLAKKKSSVVIPDLLFFIKPFLNELFVHYGSNKTALDIIQNGMANLVINMGYNEDKVFKDNTEYIGKHFNKTNKEIIYKLLK
jgi:hypothetical protein